jgi:predicted NBD/HSP70 family sugar kinase/biotin operon repressor
VAPLPARPNQSRGAATSPAGVPLATAVSPVEALRLKHRMEVVLALRDKGPLSRVELARHTGLSSTTLTKVVADLLGFGWLVEAQAQHGGEIGRPRIALELVPHACEILAVVIEPDAMTLARVGLDLEPLQLRRHEVASSEAHAAMEIVVSLVRKFRRLRGSSATRLRAISVVLPGSTDARLRTVLWSRQLGWQQLAVADLLESASGLPVVVSNNTRAMSFAEFRHLKLHEDQPLLFLQGRFGLGAAMVNSASSRLHGHYGVSELANIPLATNDFANQVPTDERLVSVLNERYLRAVLAAGQEDGPVLPLIESRRLAGDPVAEHLYEQTLQNLARALAIAVDLLHPRVIVLGGVYALASGSFVEEIARRVRIYGQPELTASLEIRCSELGALGALQGAALAAFDRLLAEPGTYR